MTYQSIWHGDGGRHVLLRCALTLSGPCRNGQLTCTGSGSFQLYLDGLRIAGGPGGAAAESPLWHTHALSGGWDAGEHELIVVMDGGPAPGRWFALHGKLAPAATGTRAHSLESGLHWQALDLPPAPSATTAHERYNALEVEAARGDWQGVVTVAAEPAGMAAPVVERQVEARALSVFEQTAVDSGLTFSPVAAKPRTGKLVHRDGLLAGPSPSASVQTGLDCGFTFVLDLGRLVTGVPNLRVRDGHGGTIDMGLATTWGRIDRHLRYVCGSGRQDWFGQATVRARYVVVHLSGFAEACQIERLALCERFTVASEAARMDLEEALASTWAQGAASLHDSRLEVYHTMPPPLPCDWLGVGMLFGNDVVHTGHTDTARATLLGRTHEPTSGGAFATCLRMYHLWSGDDDTARQLLGRAVKAATTTVDSGETTQTLALQLGGALAARMLCQDLADTVAESRCTEVLSTLRNQLETRWREDRGLYADEQSGDAASQFTQALVMAAQDVSPERATRMAGALRGSDVAPVTDLREAFALAHGLWCSGHGSRALDVIRNRWARIASREGRTWREKQSAEFDRLAPGPDFLLVAWLLGITPLSAGFKTTRVRPAITLLATASAELPTAAGMLGLAWKRQDPAHDQQTSIRLQTPEDCVIELVVDRGGRRRPSVSVNGEVVWRNEKIYPNPSVHEVGADADNITLVFGRPGIWQVVVE